MWSTSAILKCASWWSSPWAASPWQLKTPSRPTQRATTWAEPTCRHTSYTNICRDTQARMKTDTHCFTINAPHLSWLVRLMLKGKQVNTETQLLIFFVLNCSLDLKWATDVYVLVSPCDTVTGIQTEVEVHVLRGVTWFFFLWQTSTSVFWLGGGHFPCMCWSRPSGSQCLNRSDSAEMNFQIIVNKKKRRQIFSPEDHLKTSLCLQVLKYLDYVFTGVFTFEMVIKVRKKLWHHCTLLKNSDG